MPTLKARLERASLWGANLKRVDLRGSDLTDANLGGANLTEANRKKANLKGILSEGAAVEISSVSGCELPYDLVIPTRLFYGKKDYCCGRRDQHTVIFERSTPSMESWVRSLRNKGWDIELILYEEAGHGLHSGKLQEKARCYTGGSCSTYYRGASSKAVKLYERDVKAFIDAYSMN